MSQFTNVSIRYFSPYVTETLTMQLPSENGWVITNAFCPDRLLVGETILPISPIRRGLESEFYNDCSAIIQLASKSGKVSFNDALLEGLDCVVSAHIARCGRLIYTDLLAYIDCWAYLLYAHNKMRNVVEEKYPIVVKNMVNKYLQYIKEQHYLQPFSTTLLYRDIISQIK